MVTQRVSKKRGPGESMVVEVFTAADKHEQRMWYDALKSCLVREVPAVRAGGGRMRVVPTHCA